MVCPKFPTIDKVVPIPCMKRKERKGGKRKPRGREAKRETKSKGK
jgi:hypothetical protein